MATSVVSGIFDPAHIDITELETVRKNTSRYINMLKDDLAEKDTIVNELTVSYVQISKQKDAFNIQRAKEALKEAEEERDVAFKILEPVRLESSICNLFCEFVEYAHTVYENHAAEKIYDAIDIASVLKDRRDVMLFWSSVD
jgi:hypothetical protein